MKVISGNRVLAGGTAAGQFVVVKLRTSGSLDSDVRHARPGRPGAARHVAGRRARASAVFRDGRIVAAGTLRLADGTTRFVALRLLPDRRDRPELRRRASATCSTGPTDAELGAMAMDRDGNVILGGVAAPATSRS